MQQILERDGYCGKINTSRYYHFHWQTRAHKCGPCTPFLANLRQSYYIQNSYLQSIYGVFDDFRTLMSSLVNVYVPAFGRITKMKPTNLTAKN